MTWAPYPNKLPGFQDIDDDEARGKFEALWGAKVPPKPGWHLSLMFDAMERGDLRALYVIGENPAQSEADVKRTRRLLAGLDFMVVQDLFLTRTAEMADVVLPASASWAETEGTVTSSERRVQRVRKALDPPGEAKDDVEILCLIANSLGHEWGTPSAEETWDELRSLSPMHAGMAYRRLGRDTAVCSGRVPMRTTPARSSFTNGCGRIHCPATLRPSSPWTGHLPSTS